MSFLEQFAAEVTETILNAVVPRIRREAETVAKESFVFCYTEDEAAEKLKCSAQTLARLRKKGEIGFSHNAAGRPVYMAHHLLDYLKRHERKTGGKPEVTLNDVLNASNVLEFTKKKAG